ncbi:M28 family peptidase [Desulfobacterota bacterium AH_259_B03_O07]|nr:M28 family peptidase [Desulfobacterota bacterium AH_259_B03_O07]
MKKTIIIFILFVAFHPNLSRGSDSPEIIPSEILKHVRYLASDELEGRRAGTVGAEKAAEYIASEFENTGLKPLGDNGTYFQDFSLTSGVKLGDANLLTIDYGQNKDVLKIEEDYVPLSFSVSDYSSADLVFAGYGISAPELNYDDYDGIDVKDKIVLVLRYTPEDYDVDSPFYNYASLRNKAITARKKGAKGIIFTTPLSQKEESDLGGRRFDASFTDSGIQAVILRRIIAEKILNYSGRDMKSLEEKLSNQKNGSFYIPHIKVLLNTDLIPQRSKSSNVIGLLEGTDPDLRDEVIVVGAHYDHVGFGGWFSRGDHKTQKNKIHNGADDNASGIAGLLELAAFFSNEQKFLKRSLLFIAFSAEELGLIGSSYYVKNPKIPLEKTKAMLNMDMIGRLRDDKLTVFGVGTSPEWETIVESANSELGFDLKLSDSGVGQSDQTVFYTKNIPVLHFFTGVHSDYHIPSDDWQKINPYGLKKVLLMMSKLIYDLNTTPRVIAFSKVKEEGRGRSRFNVYLGTIPDYSEDAHGVRLMGVKDGSPAEKAGLRDGDIIIEFEGGPIKNIYDYVYALGEAKPGVPAYLRVIRENKKLKLRVVPEPRNYRE